MYCRDKRDGRPSTWSAADSILDTCSYEKLHLIRKHRRDAQTPGSNCLDLLESSVFNSLAIAFERIAAHTAQRMAGIADRAGQAARRSYR